MSDPINPPANPTPDPTPAPHPRGYFNKSQLADIQIAEDIHTAAIAPSHAPALLEEDIDPAFITLFDGKLQIVRGQISATGQNAEDKITASLAATGAERTLLLALQGIQSAAKQRARFEAMDGDPATNFQATGYLIGKRLNASRPKLLQNADALIIKAKTETLPGHKPAKIVQIEGKLQAYRDDKKSQTDTVEESSEERIARDKIVHEINSLRIAIQHAADRVYPYTEEENRPQRVTFKLPLDRAMAV